MLKERALAAGAEIVHGAEVVGLRQDAGGVDVDVRTADGETGTRRASYVVGADGVRSTVRRELGLPFPGQAAVRSVMLADVRLDEEPEDVLTIGAVGDAFAFIAPFGDGWYRVIAWNRHHQAADSNPSTWPSCGRWSAARSAPTTASATRAGRPGSTATNGRSPDTGRDECSS